MIIIQHIHTRWSKISRGAPQSSLRNQVPTSFKILGAPSNQISNHIHYIQSHEENDFFSEQTFFPLVTNHNSSGYNNYKNIRFYSDQEKMIFMYLELLCGLWGPNRANQVLFHLKEGQWGQFLINLRFAGSVNSYGSIFYTQDIYNIVNFNAFNSNIFIDESTSFRVDKRVNLF